MQIDIQTVLDNARLRPAHWGIVLWCTLVVFVDGYDLFMFGALLPTLIRDWGLSPAVAGGLGSAALVGMMVGGAVLGTVADRWGRKRVILGCMAVLGIFTALNGLVRTPQEFALCRFMTGLAVGGVMPNAVALVSEYSPRYARNMLVTITLAGYALGGMAAALLSLYILPLWGWRGMLYSGGVALLVLVLLHWYLPDAPAFLLRRGQQEQLRQLLRRLAPQQPIAAQHQLVLPMQEAPAAAVSVLDVVRQGRWLGTVLLCVVFFMSLLLTYGLSVWLPAIMLQTHSQSVMQGQAQMVLMALNIGSMTGSIAGGWLADRVRLKPVLTAIYMMGCVALLLMGLTQSVALLLLWTALAGAASIGATSLVYAYAAQYYPARVRASGIGWAVSVGRLGAIAGPTVIGVWLVQSLLAQHISAYQTFVLLAAPAVLAAWAVWLVPSAHHHQNV